jgi:hypothetical protein
MSSGLYSGVSGLALGTGLYKGVSGLWGGASGLITGYNASLALDFLTGAPLDSRITFTRAATVATFVGSDGLIQSAAVNVPRFDYDPVTLAPRGLLIEGQRTNLLLNSDILGTNLSTQSVSVTAQSYTISFYGTGTITLSGAAIQVVTGTGAYPSRRTLTFTATAGVLLCTVIGTVQYAQLEASLFASSFIPTAGASVTRAADSAVMTGTNFSSWYNAVEGTFVASASTDSTASARGVYAASDGTNNNRIYFSVTTNAEHLIVTSSVTQANISITSVVSDNTVFRDAFAYVQDNANGSTNGILGTPDTVVKLPVVNQFRLGARGDNTIRLDGRIRTITFYPQRLTDGQLQALTV